MGEGGVPGTRDALRPGLGELTQGLKDLWPEVGRGRGRWKERMASDPPWGTAVPGSSLKKSKKPKSKSHQRTVTFLGNQAE